MATQGNFDFLRPPGGVGQGLGDVLGFQVGILAENLVARAACGDEPDRSGSLQIWKVPAAGGPAEQVTQQGGGQPHLGPDGQTLFYLDRAPSGPGGVSGSSTLKSVPVRGGPEVPVLDGVRLFLWSVTDRGIVFLTIEPEADAIDFYDFGNRKVRRLRHLPFRVSRYAGLGMLHVDRDARWALVSVTDQWESDIKVADGFR